MLTRVKKSSLQVYAPLFKSREKKSRGKKRKKWLFQNWSRRKNIEKKWRIRQRLDRTLLVSKARKGVVRRNVPTRPQLFVPFWHFFVKSTNIQKMSRDKPSVKYKKGTFLHLVVQSFNSRFCGLFEKPTDDFNPSAPILGGIKFVIPLGSAY